MSNPEIARALGIANDYLDFAKSSNEKGYVANLEYALFNIEEQIRLVREEMDNG
jgi:hypothetical protein